MNYDLIYYYVMFLHMWSDNILYCTVYISTLRPRMGWSCWPAAAIRECQQDVTRLMFLPAALINDATSYLYLYPKYRLVNHKRVCVCTYIHVYIPTSETRRTDVRWPPRSVETNKLSSVSFVRILNKFSRFENMESKLHLCSN